MFWPTFLRFSLSSHGFRIARARRRQLIRRARVVVRKRQVGGAAREHAEGHAHEPRLHRVEARPLGTRSKLAELISRSDSLA